MCNDYHDGVNNHVQTWAQDPFQDQTSHKWYLTHDSEGSGDTVRIESFANRRRLTAGSKWSDTVTFQQPSDSLHENWRFLSADTSEDGYVIVSVVHRRYALAIADHLQGNDRLLGLTHMWGGANLSQVWKVFPADS